MSSLNNVIFNGYVPNIVNLTKCSVLMNLIIVVIFGQTMCNLKLFASFIRIHNKFEKKLFKQEYADIMMRPD